MILEIGSVVLLVVVAVALLWPLCSAAVRQRRIHAWPRITGVVTAQRIRTVGHAYFPEHEVRIQLDGRETLTWCGSADRVGITGGDERWSEPEIAAQKILGRHPVGTSMTVMVNPRDHAEAYRVERELPLTLVASLASAAFAGFIGAAVWILFLE